MYGQCEQIFNVNSLVKYYLITWCYVGLYHNYSELSIIPLYYSRASFVTQSVTFHRNAHHAETCIVRTMTSVVLEHENIIPGSVFIDSLEYRIAIIGLTEN